jgi:tRNA (guanine-N7-)-methyltransferase
LSEIVSPETDRSQRRKLYGRRKGPKLSPHQERLLETLLPELSLELVPGGDPRRYFESPVDDVWLEIGFGAGEHLLWQAEQHPNVGLIGAEPYVSGVAKLLSKLTTLPNEKLLLSPTGGEGQGEGASTSGILLENKPAEAPPHPSPLPRRGRGENIRLYSDDARNILDALPDASLGRVFLLFPDPWPKTRHHKRRFVQRQTLDTLARVMKSGAEFRFASDDAGYLNWALERLTAHPAFAWTATRAQDWHTRTTDWPQTRYEAKELHGKPAFLRFVRI